MSTRRRQLSPIRTQLTRCVIALVLGAGAAHADGADAAASAVTPPSPVELAPADYPIQEAPNASAIRVILRLTLDATGQVTEAEIAESGGPGFDEAARAAALRSRFTPAQRGDTPLPSRILFAWEFPPLVRTGTLTGSAQLAGTASSPAVGARVVVEGAEGIAAETRTGEDGRFRIEELETGPYVVRVSAPGLGQAEVQAAVGEGESTEVSVRLLPDPGQAPIEVTVQGPTASERLRRSAQAVKVIDTENARRQTADLGEVLARSEGVGVRRSGGLGSGSRFSLNGLTDDQIRFLLDGLPLDLAGYPFGIANVPVDLIERVEVYRGVVPIRFGADALGGAVHLVTQREVKGTHGALSYQGGSFGTHRLAVNGTHLHAPSGLFVRAGGFVDRAENDYPVDVEVANSKGKLAPARAYRFHDGYQAAGAQAEIGVQDRAWAKRLTLNVFGTRSEKELQHDPIMSVPWGEVGYDRSSAGATLRYEHLPAEGLSVELAGSYSYGETQFRDVGTCIYNWFGQCVGERRQAGEVAARARDQILWQHSALARLNLGWQVLPTQTLRLAVAPTLVTRTGDERTPIPPGTRNPISAVRDGCGWRTCSWACSAWCASSPGT